MYILLRNLSANGFRWKLSTKPLVIGRGHECDIRVFDSELSRRHAKVWLDGDAAYFEDLGSSNATLLNGKPSLRGKLAPGDTLGAGTIIFLVSESPELLEPPNSLDPKATPITLSARLESYMSLPGSNECETATHRTVHELHNLFQLGRALGSVESVRELTACL